MELISQFSKIFCNLFMTFLFLATSMASAQTTPLTPADVLKDFKATLTEVSQIYKSNYALADYKAQRFQWDNDTIVADLIHQAEQNPHLTVLAAQNLIQEFFNSTRDYHAQAFFMNQPYISLPLGMHSVQGRVYITFVDATYIGSIQVGDQVILYGNQDVGDALLALTTAKYPNFSGTDLRDATRRLTARYGLLMDPIPTNPEITLTLMHEDGTQYTETLKWNGFPTPPSMTTPFTLYHPRSERTDDPLPEILRGTMLADDAFGYLSRKSYFPRPDKLTWEAADTDPFYAWIGEITTVKATIKRVGLIRIPTFGLAKQSDYTAAILAFKDLVQRMNQETDLLILDIQGNRGGSFLYTEALTTFFIDSPKAAPLFQYKLFPSLLANAEKVLADLDTLKTPADITQYFSGEHYSGYPVDADFVNEMKATFQGIVDDAKVGTVGKKRPYIPALVKPYPGFTPYLKPLFVATDAWSVSGGDFFPAFMQDHKIATIIGTPTAGAGAMIGNRIPVTANSMQLKAIVAPISLGHRLNGTPLENNGVIPDHILDPVVLDLKDGKFSSYQQTAYKLLDQLTN